MPGIKKISQEILDNSKICPIKIIAIEWNIPIIFLQKLRFIEKCSSVFLFSTPDVKDILAASVWRRSNGFGLRQLKIRFLIIRYNTTSLFLKPYFLPKIWQFCQWVPYLHSPRLYRHVQFHSSSSRCWARRSLKLILSIYNSRNYWQGRTLMTPKKIKSQREKRESKLDGYYYLH